jgi:hypothetical protein
MTRFPCVSVHRPISDNINIVSLSIRHLWTQTTPLAPLFLSLSVASSLFLSLSHPSPTHTLDVFPNSLLPPPAPVLSRYYTCHTIPPSLILGLHHQWSLYSTYTHSLSHTNARTNTHRHAQTPIYLDPHLSSCPHVYLTHSLSNYVYVSPRYTTQSPMYMSLSILHTHRHKESVIIASVSRHITHAHCLSLSCKHAQQGFPRE